MIRLFKVSVLSTKIQVTLKIKKKTPQRQQRTLCLSSMESSKNTIKFVSQDKLGTYNAIYTNNKP